MNEEEQKKKNTILLDSANSDFDYMVNELLKNDSIKLIKELEPEKFEELISFAKSYKEAFDISHEYLVKITDMAVDATGKDYIISIGTVYNVADELIQIKDEWLKKRYRRNPILAGLFGVLTSILVVVSVFWPVAAGVIMTLITQDWKCMYLLFLMGVTIPSTILLYPCILSKLN